MLLSISRIALRIVCVLAGVALLFPGIYGLTAVIPRRRTTLTDPGPVTRAAYVYVAALLASSVLLFRFAVSGPKSSRKPS
jgi:hypothetical protein